MNFSTSASIFGSNCPLVLGDCEDVLPGRERVQGHAEIAHDLFALRIDVIEEDHETVLANPAGLTQRLDEVYLALAVGGEIFHQQHALARHQQALDLRAASESFWLLAHILHRQMHAVGHPGRKWNTGGLAARHCVDLVAADVAFDGVNREIHQGRAHVRE